MRTIFAEYNPNQNSIDVFIPVQVLLDKLIISSMSIHPGILISVSMPAHQMSKLHFLSLL